jgi:hypothetical protein
MLALDGPARRWEPKRLRRPPPAAAHRRDLALGHPDHHRDHPPASPRTRLTSTQPPLRQKDKPKGPWNPGGVSLQVCKE